MIWIEKLKMAISTPESMITLQQISSWLPFREIFAHKETRHMKHKSHVHLHNQQISG